MTYEELNEVCIAHRKVIARLIDRLTDSWNEEDNNALVLYRDHILDRVLLLSDDFDLYIALRREAGLAHNRG